MFVGVRRSLTAQGDHCPIELNAYVTLSRNGGVHIRDSFLNLHALTFISMLSFHIWLATRISSCKMPRKFDRANIV